MNALLIVEGHLFCHPRCDVTCLVRVYVLHSCHWWQFFDLKRRQETDMFGPLLKEEAQHAKWYNLWQKQRSRTMHVE